MATGARSASSVWLRLRSPVLTLARTVNNSQSMLQGDEVYKHFCAQQWEISVIRDFFLWFCDRKGNDLLTVESIFGLFRYFERLITDLFVVIVKDNSLFLQLVIDILLPAYFIVKWFEVNVTKIWGNDSRKIVQWVYFLLFYYVTGSGCTC